MNGTSRRSFFGFVGWMSASFALTSDIFPLSSRFGPVFLPGAKRESEYELIYARKIAGLSAYDPFMRFETFAIAGLLTALSLGAGGLTAAWLNQENSGKPVPAEKDPGSPKRKDKVIRTNEEWKKRLTPEQFKILRNQGTEAAFCGVFVDNKKNGVYSCVGCDLPLFKSDAKFDSGTGWPSFFRPVNVANIWTRSDISYGMIRVEVLCARCDGHLGHVFDDGPKPSGLRYCINSTILTFKESK